MYRTPESVEDLNVPKVYENGVNPLDVNKTNPTTVYVDSDFAGAERRKVHCGKCRLSEWLPCDLEL